jgi:hypothetical protein
MKPPWFLHFSSSSKNRHFRPACLIILVMPAKPAIFLVGLHVLAATAWSQAAGARAVVTAETTPVYPAMGTQKPAVAELRKGDRVVIGLVMFGDDVTWCAVMRPGETKRLGYVSCELLAPDREDAAAQAPQPAPSAPAAAPPAAPAPVPAPAATTPQAGIRIRELPPTTLKIRELPSPAAEQPKSSPAPATPAAPPPSAAPPAAAPPSPAPAIPPPENSRPEAAPSPASPPSPDPTPGVPQPPVSRQEAAQPPSPAAVSTAPPAVAVPEPAPASPERAAPAAAPAAPPAVTSPAAPISAATQTPAAAPPSRPEAAPPVSRQDPTPAPAAAVPSQAAAPPSTPVPTPVEPPKSQVTVARLEPPSAAPPPEVARPAPKTIEMPAGDLAEWVLEESGLRQEVAQYVRTTSLLAFLDKSRLEELDTEALSAILLRTFTAPPFLRAIGGQYRSQMTVDRNESLVEWLRSPVARKMVSLQGQSAASDAREKLLAFAGGLKASPPSQTRLELVHRLFNATEASDVEVETTMTIVKSLAEALNPSLSPPKRFRKEDLERALENVKATYLGVMKNARIVQYLFVFQSATDQDVEQYVKFWESEPGNWLSRLRRKGFEAGARTVAKSVAAEIDRKARGGRETK